MASIVASRPHAPNEAMLISMRALLLKRASALRAAGYGYANRLVLLRIAGP